MGEPRLVFLPWVLPGILVTRVFVVQERWARGLGGRDWLLLSDLGRPKDGPVSPHSADGWHPRCASVRTSADDSQPRRRARRPVRRACASLHPHRP